MEAKVSIAMFGKLCVFCPNWDTTRISPKFQDYVDHSRMAGNYMYMYTVGKVSEKIHVKLELDLKNEQNKVGMRNTTLVRNDGALVSGL